MMINTIKTWRCLTLKKDGIKSLRATLPDEIFLLGILLLEPCISLTYAWKTNKYTNYSFSLLIIYGSFCMFRHSIAIFRGGLLCLLRDAKLRSSRQNIMDGCVVSPRTTSLDTTHPSTIFCRLLLN